VPVTVTVPVEDTPFFRVMTCHCVVVASPLWQSIFCLLYLYVFTKGLDSSSAQSLLDII